MPNTLTNPLLAFNCASTFYIDPGTVKNSPQVSITGIELFFKSKPTANTNTSGIFKPGVEVALCELKGVNDEEVPDTTRVVRNSISRVEWDDIEVSNNANTATMFSMPLPPNLDTGRSYAIIVKYDGSDNFQLWKSVEGKKLVGTNSTTAGPSGKYIGKYYEFSYTAGANTATTGTAGSWKPLNTTDLKFAVYCAKFTPDVFANTTSVDPVTGETITTVVAKRAFMLQKKPYEFIVFDSLRANNLTSIHGGELIWQNNVVQPHPVAVLSGSKTITTQNANFSAVFGNSSEDDRYIVITSGANRNIRRIESIQSNNALTVEIPPSFTDPAANFSRVAAGKVDLYAKVDIFGRSETAIVLSDSNANSSLRFTNNVIEAIAVANGGTGYSNTDYIEVSGGGISGPPEVNAIANVVTNGNGTITSVRLSNQGAGFLLSPTYSIKQANGAASGGTSANVTLTVGSTLRTEHSNASISGFQVVNIPVNSTSLHAIDLENPYGTSYSMKAHYMYYAPSDGVATIKIVQPGTGYANGEVLTFSGSGSGAAAKVRTDSVGKIVDTIILDSGAGYSSPPTVGVTTVGGTGASLTATVGTFRNQLSREHSVRDVELGIRDDLANTHQPMILSRSYEVLQPETSIVTGTGTTVNTAVSSAIEIVIQSNNIYTTVDIVSSEVDVFFEKYSVNNDYELEETGDGNAIAKHVSGVVTFGDDRFAEDIRVFADIYRPVGTDVKVYARIHNSKDPEAFVDKDWTLLEIKNGEDRYSSPVNINDVLEFEFGFPQYPNTVSTSVGTVTTTLSSANLVGSNTLFQSAFANNNLVRVRSPLFANNHKVAVVTNVASNTTIVMSEPIANNSIVGPGFYLDKIGFPHQAYNNIQNGNVVRYHGTNMEVYDGYNSFAIKLVFLAESDTVVPKVENVRAVGVTA